MLSKATLSQAMLGQTMFSQVMFSHSTLSYVTLSQVISSLAMLRQATTSYLYATLPFVSFCIDHLDRLIL